MIAWLGAVALWGGLVARAGEPVAMPDLDDPVIFEADTAQLVRAAVAELDAGRFEAAAVAFRALADAGGGGRLRHAEALARYEGGEVRAAEAAIALAAEALPDDGAILALQGLILAEIGRGDEAVAILRRAEAAGRASGDARVLGRALLGRALVAYERGEGAAVGLAEEALRHAEVAGDPALVAAARATRATAAGEVASEADPLGAVSASLRRGDLAAARAAIPPEGTGRRERVARALAEAAVQRAEGDLAGAAKSAERALGLARAAGLVREEAAALAERGVIFGLDGHPAMGRDSLEQAITRLAGTHFRVSQVLWRAEAARLAAVAGDRAGASAHLAAARKIAGGDPKFPGVERLSEVDAVLAAKGGDLAAAEAALQRAMSGYEARGHHGDAARVACAGARLHAAKDDASALRWRARGEASFAAAKDPLGPAQMRLCDGMGRGENGDLAGALASFAEAERAAKAVVAPGAPRVALAAREQAAVAMLRLGRPEDAGKYGLDELVARQRRFEEGEASYARGLAAYQAGRWTEARSAFDASYRTFQGLGEDGHAVVARRGRAWATWNDAVALDVTQALPFWGEIAQEAVQVDDPELEARALVAYAMGSARIGGGDPVPRLRAAAERAESQGMRELAASVWAELAAREAERAERARAARRAFTLDPGPASVYAMYAVSVEAVNEGETALAVSLARAILPVSGDLRDAVQEVLDAAASAGAEPPATE